MQNTQSYTCYLVDDEARAVLKAFARGYQFSQRRGEHITELYDAESERGLRMVQSAEVYAMATDHTGIEAFLVRVDGQEIARDGRHYHLTWSLDPRQVIPAAYHAFEMNPEAAAAPIRYRSRHANSMLMSAFDHAASFVSVQTLPGSIEIPVTPAFVKVEADGHRHIKRLNSF